MTHSDFLCIFQATVSEAVDICLASTTTGSSAVRTSRPRCNHRGPRGLGGGPGPRMNLSPMCSACHPIGKNGNDSSRVRHWSVVWVSPPHEEMCNRMKPTALVNKLSDEESRQNMSSQIYGVVQFEANVRTRVLCVRVIPRRNIHRRSRSSLTNM